MTKKVTVLVGAGSIGQTFIRRVSAGKHVVLAVRGAAGFDILKTKRPCLS